MFFFGYVVISDLYLLQEIVILNPLFVFAEKLMLSFIDKRATGIWILTFTWNVALVVFVGRTQSVGWLAAEVADTDKSSFISQLIKDKSEISKI